MNKQDLIQQILEKKSFLCVGLDSDINKIPKHLLKDDDPIFSFNKQIIDATREYAIAYKPNIAFYESRGINGWKSLKKTIDYLNLTDSKLFTIADAKRADIANTSKQYARTFFDPQAAGLDFNAITAAPYMGEDSIEPFFEFKNKWVILLALTSNKGYKDFQSACVCQEKPKTCGDERKYHTRPLYEYVIRRALQWGKGNENLMFVVGATRSEYIGKIRSVIPSHFLLVPGVGKQGGSLQKVAKYGLNEEGGLLVNASRSIIYASDKPDFAEKAALKAKEIQQEMKDLLIKYML